MALIKTAEEIEKMRKGGALLSRALAGAVALVKPGVTMAELDAKAEEILCAEGGIPSFKGYKSGKAPAFPATLCISRNEEVVHGIGSRGIVLEEGDLVGLDIGVWLDGLCTDMAVTVPVGKLSAEHRRLLEVTRNSMRAGVEAATVGNTVRDISAAVQESVDERKYGIVKALVGHGVGHAVHESPSVPNYVGSGFPKVSLQSGMCLAIEPMITLGTDEVVTADDGWAIETEDRTFAAHFEVTIAILPDGPEIITPEPRVPGLDD